MTTVVFILSSDTSPFSKPGDWSDSGHTVELVSCGGNGGAGTRGTSGVGAGGGGGGAYYLLTYSSGAMASTTPFAIGANNSTAFVSDINATFWEGTSATNTYEAKAGPSTAGGSTGVTNGTPSPITYTASTNNGGGSPGGTTGGVIGGGGGGGGCGGTTLIGSNGGAGGSIAGGGGGGAGAANNNTVSGANAGASINGGN